MRISLPGIKGRGDKGSHSFVFLVFLQAADEVIVISGGRVAHRGTYEDLMARGVQFAHFEAVGGAADADTAPPQNSKSAALKIHAPQNPKGAMLESLASPATVLFPRSPATASLGSATPPGSSGSSAGGSSPTAPASPKASFAAADVGGVFSIPARRQTLADTLHGCANSMNLGSLTPVNGSGTPAPAPADPADSAHDGERGDVETPAVDASSTGVFSAHGSPPLVSAWSVDALVPAPSLESQLVGSRGVDVGWTPGIPSVKAGGGGPALTAVAEDTGEGSGGGGTAETHPLLRGGPRSDDAGAGEEAEGGRASAEMCGRKAGQLMAVEERATGQVERTMYKVLIVITIIVRTR